eukprot:PhM_4_TR10025/c0_g1_i2/m.94914
MDELSPSDIYDCYTTSTNDGGGGGGVDNGIDEVAHSLIDDVPAAVDTTTPEKTSKSHAASSSQQLTSSYLQRRQHLHAGTWLVRLVLERLHVPMSLIAAIAILVPVAGLIVFASFYVVASHETVATNRWVSKNVPTLSPLAMCTAALEQEAVTTIQLLTTRTTTSNELLTFVAYARGNATIACVDFATEFSSVSSDVRDHPDVADVTALTNRLDVERHIVDDRLYSDIFSVIEEYDSMLEGLRRIIKAVHSLSDSKATSEDLLALRLLSKCQSARLFSLLTGIVIVSNTTTSAHHQLLRRSETSAAAAEKEFVLLVDGYEDGRVAEAYRTDVLNDPERVALIEETRGSGIITNLTWWLEQNERIVSYNNALETRIIASLIQHSDHALSSALVQEQVTLSAIIIVAITSVFVGVVQLYVSKATDENQKAEIKDRSEVEAAMFRLLPSELLDTVEAEEIHSLNTSVSKIATRTMVMVSVWNEDEMISAGDGDIFTVMHQICTLLCRVLEGRRADTQLHNNGKNQKRDEEDGSTVESVGVLDKFHLGRATCVFEDATSGLRAALEIQTALEQLNAVRCHGQHQVPVRYGISVHSGTAIIGVVGTEHRFEALLMSRAVVALKKIARFQEPFCRVRLVVSAAVLNEATPFAELRSRC